VLREAADGVSLVRTAIQDIAERRRSEEAVEETRQRLVEEDRRKADFLAVLSHELRNPLAAIRTSLWLLEKAAPGSEPDQRARAVLNRQSALLVGLVDDLLDITRINRGALQMRMGRLDARVVVGRACDDMRATFDRRRIAFRCTVPDEPTWIDADAARLTQTLGNLLGNALKFTPPGGRVEVVLSAGDGACRVSVRDTGSGIAAGDLERIFEPFTQAADARFGAQGGLGIGLALVRQIATCHHGSVTASSEGKGRGAEFVVALPLAAPLERASSELPAVEAALAGLSVLVVEDNHDVGVALAELLTFKGLSPRVVGTGAAGIRESLALVPDVLICDVGLTDMSGYDVIRAVRKAVPPERTFAIALTGFARPEDRARATEAGFDAHLAKPLRIHEFVGLLAMAARRKARRAG
jgi:CheY-like chemotaxis protein/nitrogen-specific signal transduction histidine kinase